MLEKKKEYAKKLKEYERQKDEDLKELHELAEAEKVESTSRPKSARAARSAFSGSKIDSETLKARKALAAKLKQEVVGN